MFHKFYYRSKKNRDTIKQYKFCCCFYCKTLFETKKITKFYKKDARCPWCGEEAVFWIDEKESTEHLIETLNQVNEMSEYYYNLNNGELIV